MPYLPHRLKPSGNAQEAPAENNRPMSKEVPLLRQASDTIDHNIRVKNRRRLYLEKHPEYFDPSLELADPLLYDRLIRHFQTPAERKTEVKAKGFSGVLLSDILRSEARLDALENPAIAAMMAYRRGAYGEILAEDKDEIPVSKEEGLARWLYEMEMRFVRGDDDQFDYKAVDESEEWDDRAEEERKRESKYFADEEPSWILDDSDNNNKTITGETGIQDF